MGRRLIARPILRRLASPAAILAGAAILLWPAIFNRYPILFSDTGGLLDMGFLPSMGWDKPFVYGPLAALVSLHRSLSLVAAAQAALLSYMMWTTQSAFVPPRPVHHLALCLILAATTAAPWFASTLLPDAFTPLVVLGLVTALGALPRRHCVPVAVITAIAIAAHLSHLVLAAGTIAAIALLRRRPPGCALLRHRLPWRALVSLAAALVWLLASNAVGYGRLAISPYGSVFALARLVADGPGRDFLARTCPDPALALCSWQSRLTDDSDQFMWDPEGPFWADPLPLPEFAAQASRIVFGTIRAEPLRVLALAARNGMRQLGRADLGDTLGPDFLDLAVRPRIARWLPPTELRRFDRSRQLQGFLAPFAASLLSVQRAALAAGLAFCAALLAGAIRRQPSPRADTAAVIMIALAANAVGTGALSNVHDRYQARLVWIVVLPALLRFPARLDAQAAAGAIRTSAS